MNIGFIGYGEAAFNISLGLGKEGIAGIRATDAMMDHEVMGKQVRSRAEQAGVTLEDMISWAKANPGKLRFSVTYYGATHAAAVAMERTMGIEMNQIDVGSSTADRLTAFMANQCDVLLVNYMNIADYVENGDFVVLGICAEERLPGLEEHPTLKEQGYNVIQPKQYEVRMPKGTDPPSWPSCLRLWVRSLPIPLSRRF